MLEGGGALLGTTQRIVQRLEFSPFFFVSIESVQSNYLVLLFLRMMCRH